MSLTPYDLRTIAKMRGLLRQADQQLVMAADPDRSDLDREIRFWFAELRADGAARQAGIAARRVKKRTPRVS